MSWLRKLTCIQKVQLKRSTGLELLLYREAMRHGETRVHLVARNSKEMHLVKGFVNDPECDFNKAFSFSENYNKLTVFSLSERNFKDSLTTDFKHSH